MKLLGKQIAEKDGSGHVSLIPTDAEDMWHVYQLISAGDILTMKALRKVQRESSTGSTDCERVKMVISIQVLSVDFNPGAEVIRVNGRNCTENKFLKNGAHHTHELGVNKKFTLAKECWDAIALERIEEACDPSRSADAACVIMDEGLAHVCLLTPQMTILRTRIETTIPGKRKGRTMGYDKAMQKFYEAVLQGIVRHIDFNVVKCIILASPGYVKDDFYKYMCAEAVRADMRTINENKQKFVLSHSSSGHMHSIKEVLADPNLINSMQDTKAAAEVRALQEFYKCLKDEPDKATYGPKHVLQAGGDGAIQTLLIIDDMFRACDIETRKKYVALVERVREMGGEVRIFSSQHVSGENLAKLSGIAAILRFPMPNLYDDDGDDGKDDGFSDDE